MKNPLFVLFAFFAVKSSSAAVISPLSFLLLGECLRRDLAQGVCGGGANREVGVVQSLPQLGGGGEALVTKSENGEDGTLAKDDVRMLQLFGQGRNYQTRLKRQIPQGRSRSSSHISIGIIE